MKSSISGAFGVVVCFLLASCSERPGLAPVEELKWIPFDQKASSHIVRSNDTLFSIAFRYEKNYLQLAKINHLKPPYNIRSGQRIKLVDSLNSAPIKHHKKNSNFLKKNSRPSKKYAWQWPIKGKLRQPFAPGTGQNGIDISVSIQQPVKVALGGVVAYSGQGIPGYGNLIIVKHDHQYLTAYAHNARNLVNEGDKVIKGQKIAYTGTIGSNIKGVHFELRRNGKPVNPLNYLTNG